MSQDPAFLFYPGDYLRDTQCLSEPAQVAYDRIMCEHMRNICVTQERLSFFIKRLNVDQRAEILSVLTAVPGGFKIKWVADSIQKRREYSESRRKNREGKPEEPKEKTKKTSQSYVEHMENEDEIVIEVGRASKTETIVIFPFESEAFKTTWSNWLTYRKQIKKPYRSLLSQQAALKNLAKYPEGTAIEMIETSIGNGWQGIFEVNKSNNGKRNTKDENLRGIAAGIAKRFNEANGTG